MNKILNIVQGIVKNEVLLCILVVLANCLNAQEIRKVENNQELTFSHSPGFYAEAIELQISSLDSVYYTLDGNEPRPGSEGCYLYKAPIELKDRTDEPNRISMIRTLPEDIHFKFEAPDEGIFKTNVIRARSFSMNVPTSEVYTASYFISEDMHGRYSMPLISLTTDYQSLFDFDTGIYVPGVNLNPVERRDMSGNYFMKGKEWERKAHIEFFTTSGDLGFSQDFGIRIHGGTSRVGPQKSIRAYARPEYGESRLEYRLFPDVAVDSYKRFVLQTCDQNWKVGIFIDDVIHDLASDFTDGMASRPCITFINGEYWGIYKMRERIDEYYVESHYNVDDDEIDLLESCYMWVKEGGSEDYADLIDYMKLNDLSDAVAYDYVKEKVDIDQLIDYLATEIYFANYDWPMGNIKYWREQCDTGKWRWLLYDLDQGFINFDSNMFEHASMEGGGSWPNPDHSTFFIRSLLKNQEFNEQFITRLLYLMEHDFKPQRVLDKINEYKALFETELEEHYSRWKTSGNMNWWLRDVDQMKDFAMNRPFYVKSQMIDFFDIDSIRISSLIDHPFFIAFPNPCSDLLIIEFRDPNMLFDSYSINDIYGRFILSGTLEPEKSVYTLDLSSLPEAAYILRVRSDAEIQYSTILKTGH